MLSKKVLLLVGGAMVLGSAGTAGAVWLANGSGTAQSDALVAQSIVVDAASGVPDLFPGFTAGDLSFLLTNPNPYPVNFTGFSVSGLTSTDLVGCPTSNLSVDDSGPINIAVPAAASSLPVTLDDVVSMILAAPDACQGVGFSMTITLTGTQTS